MVMEGMLVNMVSLVATEFYHQFIHVNKYNKEYKYTSMENSIYGFLISAIQFNQKLLKYLTIKGLSMN